MGVARKQDAKEVVGTGRATHQQYQPRRLQVRHGRDTLQECVLGRALLSQEHLCERVAAERGPTQLGSSAVPKASTPGGNTPPAESSPS